ncbi:hypothetical protein SAMN05443144_12746 [Fodinibius roseus]|uniref:Uncharacterized protein n=1 Tax=Fodinibius roseus TaxID=1194090 RepID=A0A1M5JL14_9BACT|nr:fibronectin type III domain-containing protein [Fodinibius roseus]SHG41095.1 hypothetical protein SAMN05443144_12746 [Fodinibius roseus]
MSERSSKVSRRKFLSGSAKALTGALAAGKLRLPLYLLGGNGIASLFNGCTDNERELQDITENLNAEEIARTFEELLMDTPPEKLYELYNKFCLTHFGAEIDPVVYNSFGKKLAVDPGSRWEHYSERSAVICRTTTLPARSYIKYGPSGMYDKRSDLSERYFYTHLHYLNDLEPDSRYNYKIVFVDERGNSMESEERVFRTEPRPDAIRIPGDLGSPPFMLDKAGGYYLVTEDIRAGRTAFSVEADHVTLDLGGHTVTHGNTLIEDLDHRELSQSGNGIRRRGPSPLRGLRIVNGKLKQGEAENNTDYYAADDMLRPDPDRREQLDYNINRGFSNIELAHCEEVEIAGVTSEYRWHQTWGMRFEQAFGKYDIHHNVFLDKGTQMFSRHGAGGARSLGFRDMKEEALSERNDMRIHHNLIKRTRQNGFNGARIVHNNEIYVDSWAVNSFAVSPFNDHGQVYENKIFMTGYYGCGILWATEELRARDNFIHMESINTMIDPPEEGRRLIETWGEQDVLIGMRITNYGEGGQQREDFCYENNVIFGRSRGDVIMRGTALYSDYSIEDVVVENNRIKILAEDETVEKASCVVAQGAHNDRSRHLPLYYKECVLESNMCNIRFGDEYGRGSNHRFVNCTIVKAGDHPHYHTFVFDGGSSVFNHALIDCDFTGGAAYDDVYWRNTHSKSNYRIDWTLTVKTDPNADIRIYDRKKKNVFNGTSGDGGQTQVVLTQSVIRPPEWTEDGEETAVLKKTGFQEDKLFPYTVVVKKGEARKSKTVKLTRPRTIRI